MKKYWCSFSSKAKNMGVCIVEADSKQNALDKTINLGIHPENDDVMCIELDNLNTEPGLELNILYSNEDMIRLGYIPVVVRKTDWKEQIALAYKQGKTIQANHTGEWHDFIPQNQVDRPNLDHGTEDNWRIKP